MILLALLLLPAQEVDASDAAVRRAVERSLPFLEKEGVAWIRTRDCLSCHHVPFLLWTHEEARRRGIAIDEKKLAEWTEWSSRESLAQRTKLKLTDAALEGVPAETAAKLAPLQKKPALKESDFVKELGKLLTPEELKSHQAGIVPRAAREKGDGGGLDTMVQLLLAGSYEKNAFAESTRLRIVEAQQADGSWKPGGQLPRMNRTEPEGTQMTTMWALLALTSDDRARAFLKDAAPGATNEWLALRVMTGGEPARTLIGRQNADGGWGWRSGGASDAFATGQALFALDRVGVPRDDASVVRARGALLRSQGEDGSWAVAPPALTSPSTAAERLKRLEPIYRYWGTAWATIGLLRTLPPKSRP